MEEIDDIFVKFIKYQIQVKKIRISYIAEVTKSSPQYVNLLLKGYKKDGKRRGLSLRMADALINAVDTSWKTFHSYMMREYDIL